MEYIRTHDNYNTPVFNVTDGGQLLGAVQRNDYRHTWTASPLDASGRLPEHNGDISQTAEWHVGFTLRGDAARWLRDRESVAHDCVGCRTA